MANEQTSVPLYAASEILTAANMNISAGTGVPVFATTVTRDAAFGGAGEKVLAEGQLCYLSASNIVQYYDGAAWATVGPAASGGKLLQLVSTAKTDTYSQAVSQVYTDVTGLSVAITPTLATSKVYVSVTLHAANDAASGERGMFRIMRDSTAIAIGDTAGSRTRATTGYSSLTAVTQMSYLYGINFLDSPATTSATTYKIQMFTTSAAVQYVNRTQDNADAAYTGRMISTITVMEIGV
jgi:hypothetical protein